MKSRIQYPSEKPLTKLISQLIKRHKQFDYINGVLSSKAFGEYSVWNWWGELLLVRPDQQYGSGAKAGDMDKLASWNWKRGSVVFTAQPKQLSPITKED